jgi:hypothetical protein
MKRFSYSILTLTAVALVGIGKINAAPADTDQEQALLYSGFKVKSASSVAQSTQVRGLPDNEFTMVKQNGTTYYLYPDKRDGRLYAGDQYAYRAYQRFIKDRQLREKGVFVLPTHPENKSDPKNVQIWHDWGPFPAWKEQGTR